MRIHNGGNTTAASAATVMVKEMVIPVLYWHLQTLLIDVILNSLNVEQLYLGVLESLSLYFCVKKLKPYEVLKLEIVAAVRKTNTTGAMLIVL